MKRFAHLIFIFPVLIFFFSSCVKEVLVQPSHELQGTYEGDFRGTYFYKGRYYNYQHLPLLSIYPAGSDYEMGTFDGQGRPVPGAFTPMWHTYNDSIFFGNYYYFSNTGQLQSGQMKGAYDRYNKIIHGVFLASALIALPPHEGGGFIEVPVEGEFRMKWTRN